MKQLFLGLLTTLSLIIYSCGDSASTTKKEEQSSAAAASEENAEVKVIKASFTNVEANAGAYLKKITDNYLQIKNALTATKATEAGDAAKSMFDAMKGFDKSLLSADQKKVYDAQEAGLKENAEHISNSTNNIERQREHFSNMSDGMYALVKAFGGGKTLYMIIALWRKMAKAPCG
jgi:hypothetical protein